MLALYRSGRQAEALDVYRRAREALVEEFGIEPTPALRQLERAILTQEPSLDLEQATARLDNNRCDSGASIGAAGLDGLLALAEPLASRATREVIVARLLADAGELADEASALNAARASISVPSRVAAFISRDAVADICHLATAQDVELVLMDAPPGIDASVVSGRTDGDPGEVARGRRARRACTRRSRVGSRRLRSVRGRRARLGGARAGSMACIRGRARGSRLSGPRPTRVADKRDASRLLADASLAVQRVVGVETTPLLAEASGEALVARGRASERRRRGHLAALACARESALLGVRSSAARSAPVVLVHRGPRPGGLAPHESRTRFSWSIEAS